MHDLRHSYASVAANLGESLPMIGKLLGHTQAQATARYAHLAADPVKEATERIARSISEAMGGWRGGLIWSLYCCLRGMKSGRAHRRPGEGRSEPGGGAVTGSPSRCFLESVMPLT